MKYIRQLIKAYLALENRLATIFMEADERARNARRDQAILNPKPGELEA